MKRLCVLLLLGGLSAYAAASRFDVTDYGAHGDGKTNDGAAIQKAIDACARNGGGTVYLTPGNFLSGTIALKSNVALHLEPGATLWGSRQMSDFNPPYLIYARGAENIAIEGSGMINGNGDAYWYPAAGTDPHFRPREHRPSPLIELEECRNVRIRDIHIRNTPGWAIHPLNCDGVWIRGISIVSPMLSPNTDGIDPDSSRNVFISGSYIEVGDDCIVLKTTGRGRTGLPTRACENVTVTNCVLVSDDTALKLGTESYGDFRHCNFSNCVIRGTRVGLGIYAKDGGTFEAVTFSGITMETYPTHPDKIEYAIFVDLEKRQPDSRQSRVRDISFNDLTIHTRGRVLVGGMPENPLENLSFRNILMRVTGFVPVEGVTKTRGSSNVRAVGRGTDYAEVPAAFIFANPNTVHLTTFSCYSVLGRRPPEWLVPLRPYPPGAALP
ncbi:MAG: glycoside hydrolase family 28 protein, partial [Bryobacteraceae bacterium]